MVLDILAEIFEVNVEEFRRRRRSSPLRAVAALYLIRYAGQSQRDAAKLLDAGSGAAISKQLTRYSEAFRNDKRLRRLMKKAEKRLEEERSGDK